MKVCNKSLITTPTDSGTVPATLKNVKIGSSFCAGAACSTGFNTAFLESWFRSNAVRRVGQTVPPVQPISARLPRARRPRNPYAVHQVDMPGDSPPMVASVRPQSALQEFEMIVPISTRQPGPGVWNNREASVLTMAAYFWEQHTEREKEVVCMLLWRCFNNMFPTDSQDNADEWAAEQWYEPLVDLTAQDVADFECQSVDNRCTVCIHVYNNFVQVYYRGPVHFDFNLAHAARARARDEATEAADRHATDVWHDVIWAENELQREQVRQNAARAEQLARDEEEARQRAQRHERARLELARHEKRQRQRQRLAALDEWSHDDQDNPVNQSH
jgi:hypothetical protein